MLIFTLIAIILMPPADMLPEIRVSQITTTTIYAVPLPAAPSVSLLRRLGLPEEGLQPIDYSDADNPELDISISFEDIWYALRVALTEYRLFEQNNAWPALMAIAVITLVIGVVYRISTRPPEV